MSAGYMRRLGAGVLSVLLMCTGCTAASPIENSSMGESVAVSENVKATEEPAGISPKDDFYAYSTQNLAEEHPVDNTVTVIPSEAESCGWNTYMQLGCETREKEIALCTEIAAKKSTEIPEDSPEYAVNTFFRLARDKAGREAQGITALQPVFDQINKCTTAADFMEMVGGIYEEYGLPALFILTATVQEETAEYFPSLIFAPLSRKAELEPAAYEAQLPLCLAQYQKLFASIGYEAAEATKMAEDVIKIDAALAQEIENVPEDVTAVSELDTLFPNLKLSACLKKMGVENPTEMPGQEIDQLALMNAIMVDENLEQLKSYLISEIVIMEGGYLSDEISALANEIVVGKSKAMGYETPGESDTDLLHDSAELTDEQLFDFGYHFLHSDIASAFTNEYCTQEILDDVGAYVEEVRAWYLNRMEQIDWLSPKTKAAAIAKLKRMQVYLGQPECAVHLSGKTLEEGGSLVLFIASQNRELLRQNVRLINDPSYYRKVWDVSKFADSANASYMPSTNNIVIPFGMMQAPFYDKNASRAENSGGLFFTICHELTHAFGSDGALYDEVGRKRNWWTDEDFAKFEERSKSMVSYYEQWEYKPGEKQDAKIALNENIADQGAIHCMLSLVGDDPEQQKTAMECFARCEYEMRPDAYYKIVIGRTHSFAPIRVNGTVAATDEFQKAYHVEPGDKMYVAPEARPRLW